jgi:hypothetical protein
MLRKTFYIAFISTICLVLTVASNFFIISKKDYEDFKKLNNLNKPTFTSDITQNREDVQKDLYMIDDNERVHFQISSTTSVLYLKQNKNNIDFYEKLSDINCNFQDKFIEKNNYFYQHLKNFTSKNGIYKYPSHSFVADDVSLNFYYLKKDIDFHNLERSNAYLQGKANNIELKLINKKPILQANDIDALFFPNRGF